MMASQTIVMVDTFMLLNGLEVNRIGNEDYIMNGWVFYCFWKVENGKWYPTSFERLHVSI
jgi:hypothetical protein